ncbi:helix-turn-helix transcriptional regulator [Paenibacillus oceani]|uniref:Helix-turn-helix transcriptional regulator n=1 Tax=Paenibacillus oceani TaxID=2772510 RepID=A0A927CC44_9BACL|nr:AraC family transcriptional regulator [Paenibacillus oceani]MBD2863857.1 helix-turn-helix transcriptional regulator [Paenibacillus oceani]
MLLRRLFGKKDSTASLFVKLLSSFMVIIGLLASFSFASNVFLLRHVQSEMVKTNQASLNKTVGDYENQIRSIKKFAMSLYLNETAKLMNGTLPERTDYGLLYRIHNELQTLLADSPLKIHNIVYMLHGNAIVVDKEGTRGFGEMFENYYGSAPYSSEFWLSELRKLSGFAIYPEAEFYMNAVGQRESRGAFIPILFQNPFYKQFSLLLLVDSTSMFRDYYGSGEGSLAIYDGSGQSVFASSSAARALSSPELAESSETGYKKLDGYYAYVQKGAETGFAYAGLVPTAHIESEIARLNWTLAAFLLVSISIGLVVSLLFTRRLNNPLRRILESIQQSNYSMPASSNIKEFDLLGGQLIDILKTNDEIRQDISQKNSLLKHYAYINRLKKIHPHSGDWKSLAEVDKPFILIGFHLLYRNAHLEEIGVDVRRSSYFVREMIHTLVSELFPDSLTFQIEQNLILTILFSVNDPSQTVPEALQRLKTVLDMDRHYYLATVTASPIQTDPASFNPTYEHILERVLTRGLGDDTQLLPYRVPPADPAAAEWDVKGLQTHLEADNEEELVRMGQRMLAALDKKGASLQQFASSVQTLSEQLTKLLPAAERQSFMNVVRSAEPDRCYTLESFERTIETCMRTACSACRRHRNGSDPVCDYVIQYVEKHYGEDLSLDIISDHLNMSASYLSTYFKDKTGTNFSEYVQSYRMNKAALLLETTELKILDIAQQVGYQSVNSFIRNFKRHTGFPPGEYRKKRLE